LTFKASARAFTSSRVSPWLSIRSSISSAMQRAHQHHISFPCCYEYLPKFSSVMRLFLTSSMCLAMNGRIPAMRFLRDGAAAAVLEMSDAEVLHNTHKSHPSALWQGH
jgi:hypothetical protein